MATNHVSKSTFKYQGKTLSFDGLTDDRRGIKSEGRILWAFPAVLIQRGGNEVLKAKSLPPYSPSEIETVVWDHPDLTKNFPETVLEDYRNRLGYFGSVTLEQHCERRPADLGITDERFEQIRREILNTSLEEYSQSFRAREVVWRKHGGPRLARRFGYHGFSLFLTLREFFRGLGYNNPSHAEMKVRELKFMVRYDDPHETKILLTGVKEESYTQPALPVGPSNEPAIEGLLKSIHQTTSSTKNQVAAIHEKQADQSEKQGAIYARAEEILSNQATMTLKIDSVTAEHQDLRQAKAALEKMRGEGLFAFVNRIDGESFRILCAVLVHGDVAKASRALGLKDSTMREQMRHWRTRGPEFRVMIDLVRWRKKIGRRAKVKLPESLVTAQAPNVDHAGVLSDVLEELMSFSADNWEDKCEALAELIRPCLPRENLRL